jgi:uncharacterized membrane protein
MNEDVDVCRNYSDLPLRGRLIVLHAYGREQDGILKGEVMLGIEEHAFKARCQLFGRAAQPFVPSSVVGKVALYEATELGARG